MRKIYKYFFLAAGLMIVQSAIAQQTCKVLMPAISAAYEGDCKKGKADGNGKAEGTDQYLGEFKNGMPHGKGIYRWKNGNFYDGEWVNGRREGNGGMAYKRNGKADSVVTGYWKKDAYAGKNEKKFTVYSRSSQISKVNIKFTPSAAKEITINVSSMSGNTSTLGEQTTKATLGDVSIAWGLYIRLVKLFETSRQNVYKLEDVTFPFRAKFHIDNQEVDVEFLENGKYILEIALNN